MLSLTERLKDKKLKVTPQRLAIYKILSNTTAHPNAETIYHQLIAEYPTISLATVYKTLDTLIENELIQGLNVGESSFRYDANPLSHPHFICESCNRVIDLEFIDVNEIKRQIVNTTNCTITKELLFFYGHCSACKKEEESL